MISKRTRVSNADRISSLPDDIISHILSFLPTEDSVRTSVLSTRWKHLFSLVPILTFHKPSSSTCVRKSFREFIGWVHNNVTFRMGVRKIEFDVCLRRPFKLPFDIFTCKTLTDLSLKGDICLDVPKDVYLPRLRSLRLWRLSFIDGSAKMLFQNCPMLEELFLKYCSVGKNNIEHYDISIPSLRNLTIIHALTGYPKFLLNCPNLEYLTYSGGAWGHEAYTTQGLDSLVKAHINYISIYEDGYEAFEKLLIAVRNVHHLSFSGSTWKDFIQDRYLPMFFNLTHLELKRIICPRLILVLDLLERTPHLQVLRIDYVVKTPKNYNGKGNQIHLLPKCIPTCVSLHLKKVELKGFSKSEQEFKMVKYFLKKAQFLDIMKIQFKRPTSPKKQIEVINKLLNFTKCSATCELVLLSGVE